MADLSSLLNPAPSSEPTPLEVDGAEKTTSNGRKRSSHLPHVNTDAPNDHPSIKSPLDTLADAATATSSAPLLSSTNPNSSFSMSMSAYGLPNGPSSSRPTSSHITPPLPFDSSQAPAPTSPTFSPGLQQYHHPASNEIRARRSSEAAEPSSDSLPPLRQTLPDQHFSQTRQSVERPLGKDSSTEVLPGIIAAARLTDSGSSHNQIDDAPVPSHVRQPSPGPSLTAQTSNLPPIQPEQAKVKTEITDAAPDLTSFSQPPAHLPESSAEPKHEPEPSVTPVAAADTLIRNSPAPTNNSNPDAMLKPPLSSNRKRPAPKKGTATAVKPAAKKRKVETVEKSIDKSSPRKGTPTSNLASKIAAPRNRKQESATPQRSSSVAHDDDDDDEDGVFCICRGPDNHTWMIACDGPCEDWFHGRCINMTEKEGDLIEKYYCPNCSEAGKGETLWKRMCRLEGCIQPARINGEKKSKYCCDEHGCEFMKREALKEEQLCNRIKGGSKNDTTGGPIIKKGRQTNNSFADSVLANEIDNQTQAPSSSPHPGMGGDDGASAEESQLHQRGGALRSTELKALVDNVKDISEFRRLGNGPVETSDGPEPNDVKMEDAPSTSLYHTPKIPYNATELEVLQTFATKKDELRARKKMLDDRDLFLALAQKRRATVLGEITQKDSKIHEICGFDTRLVWSDEEFAIWRNSLEGAETMKKLELGSPTALEVPMELAPHLHEAKMLVNGDHGELANVNGVSASPANHPPAKAGEQQPQQPQQQQRPAEGDELGKGMCLKKRCGRHNNWYKLQHEEIAFAKDEVRQEMRRLGEEEKGVKDRAKVRWLEARD
ncbi:MAG: hypothetical protein Q9182_004408 [Xanthomendoza sp. 2 TL-2023]